MFNPFSYSISWPDRLTFGGLVSSGEIVSLSGTHDTFGFRSQIRQKSATPHQSIEGPAGKARSMVSFGHKQTTNHQLPIEEHPLPTE